MCNGDMKRPHPFVLKMNGHLIRSDSRAEFGLCGLDVRAAEFPIGINCVECAQEYLRISAESNQVAFLHLINTPSDAMRSLVERMVIVIRSVPKEELFDALKQWHREASTMLAAEETPHFTEMISPPVDDEELRKWQALTPEERAAAVEDFKKRNGR